jgi:hypothetical protein
VWCAGCGKFLPPRLSCGIMAALNPRQLRFIELYLATGNATKAYIDAGYKGRGRSAENAASVLLGNVGVKDAIEKARKKATATHGITAEWYAERVKIEATREGEGASHGARVSALRLAGEMLQATDKGDDKPAAGSVPVELVTRMFAVLGTKPARAGIAPPPDPVDTEAGGAVGGVAE